MKHWQANEKWTLGMIHHFLIFDAVQTPIFLNKTDVLGAPGTAWTMTVPS